MEELAVFGFNEKRAFSLLTNLTDIVCGHVRKF